MNLNPQTSIREHSVFLEKFEDGSVYYAAKIQWPENAKNSLAWAESQNHQRPLVERYLQFNGYSTRLQLVSGLSKLEANLIKNCILQKKKNLNILKETSIELSSHHVLNIQNYCECSYNRAKELVEIFNSLK